MKRAAGDAVKIWFVAAANRSEKVQIEVRVTQFERIEGPLNQANSTAQRLFALKQFEHAADAAIAIALMNAGVMRMQIYDARLETDERERVSDELGAVECAQHLSAGICGDNKSRHRLDFEVGFAPDRALQVHARVKFRERVAFAHDDAIHHRRCPALRTAGT